MLEASEVARQQGFAMAFGILLASLIGSFPSPYARPASEGSKGSE